MVLQMCAKCGFQEKSGSLGTGPFVTPKRPPKGSFDCFSKTVHLILLIFCQNGALIVLDVCVKFGVQQKSGSPDMGQKGVETGSKWSFSGFSRKVFISFFRYCTC